MRLSWYADTGVAVFSIWQAGMCTGTFRLPMADLGRMIAILERGPTPQGRGRAPVRGARQGTDRGSDSDWYYGPDGSEPARAGAPGSPDDYAARPTAGYSRGGQGAADYGRGESGPADYYGGGHGSAGQPSGDDYGAQDHAAGYRRDEFAADEGYQRGYEQGSYEQAGYEQAGYEQAGYEQAGYEQAGYEQGGYEQAGYEQGGYGGTETDYQTGDYPGFAAERRVGSDRGYAETDGSGYRDERFAAPPYSADDGRTYANDNPVRGSGYAGDIGDAVYAAERRSVSRPDRYLEPAAEDDAYSYPAEYRYR